MPTKNSHGAVVLANVSIVERKGRNWVLKFDAGREVPLRSRDWQGSPFPRAVREGWAKFLESFQWQVFFTGTLRCRHGIERLFREFGAAVNRMAQHLFGRHYHRDGHPGLGWFVVIERHQSGDPHVHSLVMGIPNDQVNSVCVRLADWWTAKFGRATAEPVESAEAVSRYLPKEAVATELWRAGGTWRQSIG